MEKLTNAPITPIRPLPGDSLPLGVINTAATRGGNGSHSRGGGETGPQGHILRSKKKRTEGENLLHPPRPANCTLFGLQVLFLFRSLSTDPRTLLCKRRIEDFHRAQIVKFVSFTGAFTGKYVVKALKTGTLKIEIAVNTGTREIAN